MRPWIRNIKRVDIPRSPNFFFSFLYFLNPSLNIPMCSLLLGGVESIKMAILTLDRFCNLSVIFGQFNCHLLEAG